MRNRRELRAYLKEESVYSRVTKPYTSARALTEQYEYYTNFSELEEKYYHIKATKCE